MKQKLEKWLRWLDIIQKDTEDLLDKRHIFSGYIEIVKNNTNIQDPSDFHWWVRDNYVASIAMCIRRQVDTDPDVITLGKLLKEIQNEPQVITKAWHRSLYKNLGPDMADKDFEDIAGNGIFFDPAVAERDLKKLVDLAENITKFADRTIAHNSKQPIPVVKFRDLDAFIEEFEKMLIKYILLFTGSGYIGILPTRQYDWEKIFYHKWIDTESKKLQES